MTVIAWDGKTLAADKQSTCVGKASKVTKIFRVAGGRVAFAGNAMNARELLEWFRAGRPMDAWPKARGDDVADALFICDDGVALGYSGLSPHPEVYEDTFLAMGCGRDYALAAMHLGHDARKAVEVACALDVNCGLGIDALESE